MSESFPVTDISDDKLLELWRDPIFSGSYIGVKTFQILLKTDLNINVSESRLYKILRNDQIFLMHQRKTKLVDFLKIYILEVHHFRQLLVFYIFNFFNTVGTNHCSG